MRPCFLYIIAIMEANDNTHLEGGGKARYSMYIFGLQQKNILKNEPICCITIMLFFDTSGGPSAGEMRYYYGKKSWYCIQRHPYAHHP